MRSKQKTLGDVTSLGALRSRHLLRRLQIREQIPLRIKLKIPIVRRRVQVVGEADLKALLFVTVTGEISENVSVDLPIQRTCDLTGFIGSTPHTQIEVGIGLIFLRHDTALLGLWGDLSGKKDEGSGRMRA